MSEKKTAPAPAARRSSAALELYEKAVKAVGKRDYDRARDHLDALIAAIPRMRPSRDEIRRVVVGILDELGADHPLASVARAKLASALY